MIFIPLILAFAAVVYGRARDEADEGLRARLLVRARTIADAVEIDEELGEYELEISLEENPEYGEVESGAYFVVHDLDGDVFASSPSLGDHELPAPAPWKKDDLRHEEIESGPGGSPCAVLTLCFEVRIGLEDGVDDDDDEGEIPASLGEPQPWMVQVALETTDRDRGLASLALFLAASGGLAVGLALLGGWILSRRLLRPVRSMTESARTLTPGAQGRRLEPDRVVTELHSLAQTLNGAFDRLDDALQHQRRFTADASHELRTPASILLSNAELLLRRERTPEEYRKGLERQASTAKRMATLISDLLTLARADSGRMHLDITDVDLSRTARSVCREHESIAAENGVEITCSMDRDVRVDGDPYQLTQLVANLVSNAMKFASRGGHVDVRVRRQDREAVLTVTDDGPGIAEEHHHRLFERFYRVDEERSSNGNGTGGTGLGLAIVAWIVEAHRGSIDVESRPGEGATFRVTIPLRSASRDG